MLTNEIKEAVKTTKFEKFSIEDILLYLTHDLHCIDEPQSWKEAMGAVYTMLFKADPEKHFKPEKFTPEELFINLIKERRELQNKIHPPFEASREQWKLLIIEEYGEMVQAYNDILNSKKQAQNIYVSNFLDEAIDFVAMIVRFLEEGVAE